jgi:hypothetical protein
MKKQDKKKKNKAISKAVYFFITVPTEDDRWFMKIVYLN